MFDVLNGRLDGLQDKLDGLHKDLSESVDRVALMYERNGKLERERERDAGLSAMWGLICAATNTGDIFSATADLAESLMDESAILKLELDRLRASVSLQARDGH